VFFWMPCFLHSWEDSSTIFFCQCLTLKKAGEYNYTATTLQPMMPTIFRRTSMLPYASYTLLLKTLSLHLFFTINLNAHFSWIGLCLPKF
jgi:hypothetical protein